jgi:uncharacterized protein (DUF169 family)
MPREQEEQSAADSIKNAFDIKVEEEMDAYKQRHGCAMTHSEACQRVRRREPGLYAAWLRATNPKTAFPQGLL